VFSRQSTGTFYTRINVTLSARRDGPEPGSVYRNFLCTIYLATEIHVSLLFRRIYGALC